MADNINETYLEESINNSPQGPYPSVKEIYNNKTDEENLEKAVDIMNKLNLDYQESVELYNNVTETINKRIDNFENSPRFEELNTENQFRQVESIAKQTLDEYGYSNNKRDNFEDIKDLYVIKNINTNLENKIKSYNPKDLSNHNSITNLPNINLANYDNEKFNNTYHSDIYKYRKNDNNFDQSIKLRDEYFNKVENFDTNYKFSDYKDNVLKDIRQKIDISTKEYNQILNVDKLMNRLEESPNIDLSDYNISLANSEFSNDGSVKLQLHNGNEQYVIDSSKTDDLINIKNGRLREYNFDEERSIDENLNDYKIQKGLEQNLNKLKSMELEKNVINTIPKDDQNDTFKETLSRLDKNQSEMKNNLKNYISESKINDSIESIKKHFENIKLKAEEVQKNFKDLGSWNVNNNFVKNIDSVINKVKTLSQKHENKIDINDPNSLSKIEDKIKQSNEFIEKVESYNAKENKLKENKITYLQNALEVNDSKLSNSINDVDNTISNLSKNEKINLYNSVKDISSMSDNKLLTNDNDIKTVLGAEKLSKALENDLGKNEFNSIRKDYLTSSVKKPSQVTLENNENLKEFNRNANQYIQNASKDDLKNYMSNANKEIKSINDNSKANQLKNNELIKKFNNREQQPNISQQIKSSEHNEEQSQSKKRSSAQIR